MPVFPDQTKDPPMAKKKGDAPKKMGRPPLEEGVKGARFSLRVSPEWLEWLARFSTSERKDKAVLAREGLKELAKARKFDPPPEE